jgi:hypothetical protein
LRSNELLGTAGACVVAVAAVYYIVDIFRGGSAPHSGSWLVWTVVGVLGFGATSEAGAGPGAYAAGVYVGAYAVTFLISLHPRFGKPGIEWYDWPLCGLAIAGVLLWRFGPLSGAAAVTLAVTCDLVGLWPTLREAWRRPELESPAAWSADTAGNTLCLLAVGSTGYAAIAYPIYLVAGTGAVAAVLILRRRAQSAAAAASSPASP